MKSSKIALSVFFALSLAVVCLIAAVSVDGLAIASDKGLEQSSIWYAVGGFALGLIAGILILKYLSPRTLSISSLALGSLAFIALALLLYFYYQNKEAEDTSGKVSKPTSSFLNHKPGTQQNSLLAYCQ